MPPSESRLGTAGEGWKACRSPPAPAPSPNRAAPELRLVLPQRVRRSPRSGEEQPAGEARVTCDAFPALKAVGSCLAHQNSAETVTTSGGQHFNLCAPHERGLKCLMTFGLPNEGSGRPPASTYIFDRRIAVP